MAEGLHNLEAFIHNEDIYFLIKTLPDLYYVCGVEIIAFDEIQVIWRPDKRVEVYLVWHFGHMERLSPHTPVLFKSTYPTSRFLYIVQSAEDLEEFDPRLPAIVNHVVGFAHIPGVRPFSRELKFAYKIMDYDYSFWDKYFGWIFYPLWYS